MEAFEALFSSKYFIVVIIVLVMMMLVIASYLIKLQAVYKKEKTEEIEDKNDPLDDIISLNKVEETKEVVEEVKPIEEQKIEIEKEEKIEPITTSNIDETMFDMNTIDTYETDEESSAIISADELKKATENRAESLGIDSNEELINYYEEEQEKKAIISYEELLNNASRLKVNYVPQEAKEVDAPVVRKVEVPGYKSVSYEENEEFLKLLKEFCLSIK